MIILYANLMILTLSHSHTFPIREWKSGMCDCRIQSSRNVPDRLSRQVGKIFQIYNWNVHSVRQHSGINFQLSGSLRITSYCVLSGNVGLTFWYVMGMIGVDIFIKSSLRIRGSTICDTSWERSLNICQSGCWQDIFCVQ